MLQQFPLEDAATLHKETAIDGLVRHVHVSIARKGAAKPAGDLLRRPLTRQLAGHGRAQARTTDQPTPLGTPGARPRSTIGSLRTIPAGAAIALNLAADRRRRTPQPLGDRAHGLLAGETARDLFSFRFR